ncbi:TK/HMTK protein kinase [Salpingoeca rosetta]|uniref:TK/HMTK protein kinase n=1 Tax=Salpingoeca rosetta (strain ATCC 50818 / BSB-021) TaxID=946362 RepID=F2UHL1_SALR5|nr:TK/HMTK protein kinase [Salpingoeca rosetta]EGD76610.1 TK/HMTK protein kinase [Salpingoeca rosetta]|eukprot:XP_004991524.1 TK/HMTK protein kinase [Salpingoeca rosetta]
MSRRNSKSARKGSRGSKGEETPQAPPEFHDFNDAFSKLDVAQQASFLDMFQAGEMTAEEARLQIQEMSEHAHIVKYLGSVPVAAAKLTATMWDLFGKEVISTAGPRLKALKLKPVEAMITISASGIRVINTATQEVIENEPMEQVVYSAVDASDKKRVAVLSHYSKLGLIYCHVFSTKDKVCQEIAGAVQRLVQAKPVDEVSEADRHEKATGATLGIFETDYVGSATKPRNEHTSNEEFVGQVVEDLRAAMKEKKKKEKKKKLPANADRVVMVISSEGIRIVDALSREVITSIYITKISYVTKVMVKKDRYFAIIFKDGRLNKKTCQLFQCLDDEAQQICNTVKEAFKVAKEDVKAREGNPFMPMSSLTEPVKGALAECQVPRRSLNAIRPLGAGQFGEVFLALEATDGGDGQEGVKRAVKMLRGAATTADKAEFMGEAAVMNIMRHQNIVALAGICAQHRPWLVVLEFCPHGDLHGALRALRERRLALSIGEQLRIAENIAAGLEFVASKRYVHLDVAARNCLIGADGTIKVADFGLAKPYDAGKPYFRLRRTLKLSIRWIAVEALQPPPKRLSEFSDVWAFGVTMWEIATYGRMPYHTYRLHELQRLLLEGLRLEQPQGTPHEVFAVMQSCWRRSPGNRPNFSRLRQRLMDLQMVHEPVANIATILSQGAEDGGDKQEGFGDLDDLLKQYDFPQADIPR